MKKFSVLLLIMFNMTLHGMHNTAIIDGFDWNEIDIFSLEDFREMKKNGSFKLAVLTTDNGAGKWTKRFCSAQNFAYHLLTTEKKSIDPANKQKLLGLATVTYVKSQDAFTEPKYYDVNNWFACVYEILSTTELAPASALIYSKACMDTADKTFVDYLRASYRCTALEHLNRIIINPKITSVQEQDASRLLLELHMCNTPTYFKNFKSIEKYAQRILDLQEKIKSDFTQNILNDHRGIFDLGEPVQIAKLLLGKIYSSEADGVDQNIPDALRNLEDVIKDANAHKDYLNEALLTRISIYRNRENASKLPLFVRIKMVRQRSIQNDLRAILQSDPTPSHRKEVENIMNEMRYG
ncbi:MAG: hypothetical protein K2X90_02975 [Candidatus Babeliaceae bacterium]|nr:hypothetical protein [Candidatus Babeliaceae bacterium]